MKTFQEFIAESKAKKIKELSKEIERRVNKDIKKQKKKNPDQPVVADYGNPPVGSKESEAAIMAMMRMSSQQREKMKKDFERKQNT